MREFDLIHQQTTEIYNRHASAWDEHRPGVFFERKWLDKFIGYLAPHSTVLDVGCGAGQPISGYLIKQGFQLTGVDASVRMLEISRRRFPGADWIEMDMRQLDLPNKFDGIIGWDSFFHLNQHEQRKVLELFSEHLGESAVLMLTIGHEAGEVLGTVEGDQVYHASLQIDEYLAILRTQGFNHFDYELEDRDCGFHSILLAKRGSL